MKHAENSFPLPAIAEEDETLTYHHPLFGTRTINRLAGTVLHPEREPLEILKGLREQMGTLKFAGQYQQAPAPAEGAMVKPEWFQTYLDKPKFDYVIQSWDTANKVSWQIKETDTKFTYCKACAETIRLPGHGKHCCGQEVFYG